MKHSVLIFLFLAFNFIGFSQGDIYREENIKISQFTDGTLTVPSSGKATSLVIFIQGSGAPDRDGNQSMMKNDGTKKIARKLAESGIASFRYDKRVLKMSELKIKEEDLRFTDLVTDVQDILTYFEEKDQFENLVIAGHSQGSLVGILASREKADAFISLAGAGEPIDKIIVEQVNVMAPQLGENARKAFNEMKDAGKTSNYSPMLESIFRKSIQPYMYSWMQFDPAEEIKKLDIPILIVNGTADIQVAPEQAVKLAEANENARLVIIENMNHIFREIKTSDRLVNTKSYNEPNRPLHPDLIPVLTEFIKELE